MTAPAAQQRYWLGDSPPEISYLLAQAEFLGPDAADLLDRIGVAPGANVIGTRNRSAAGIVTSDGRAANPLGRPGRDREDGDAHN
jgi:hypothetical protein